LLSVESHFAPRFGWLVDLGTHAGLREETVLSVAWICLFAAGCSLLMGLACRFSAILAWFLHLGAAKSGGFVSYVVDNFIFICLLEIGYPFFIWNGKTRKIWLICICAMHAGIGLTMGMYLFGLIMIVINVAAFGPGLIRAEGERISLQPLKVAS